MTSGVIGSGGSSTGGSFGPGVGVTGSGSSAGGAGFTTLIDEISE